MISLLLSICLWMPLLTRQKTCQNSSYKKHFHGLNLPCKIAGVFTASGPSILYVSVSYPVQKETAVLMQMYDSIWSGFRWVNTCTWKSNISPGRPLLLAQGSIHLTGQGESCQIKRNPDVSSVSSFSPYNLPLFSLSFGNISKFLKEPRK